MEKSGNEILKDLQQELAQLRSRIDELDRRISQYQDAPQAVSSTWDEPIDIMMDEEISFVVPSRKDELEAKPLAQAKEPEQEQESILKTEEEPAVKKKPASRKQAPAAPASMHAWHTDTPASRLSNILSGISMRERGLFINTLFKEDAQLFIDSVNELNTMSSLEQAESYIRENFPEWNLSADVVYKFMMAVRRKLG